jgi:hypothetical protein
MRMMPFFQAEYDERWAAVYAEPRVGNAGFEQNSLDAVFETPVARRHAGAALLLGNGDWG